jgi:hypothetical protein
MNKSVDGTFQALKSYLIDPDIGLLGLGRKLTMNFSDVGRTLGPKIDKDITVFKMFRDIFGTFGVIVGPILEQLPKIFDPLKGMLEPLKRVFVVFENTQKAVLDASNAFAKMGLDFSGFRGALKGFESLARQFGGGDVKEMEKLDKMLGAKNLDFGAALQQAFKVLFSSDAMEKIGASLGEMLGTFLSMLAGLGKEGEKLADQSGIAKGFMSGWRKSGGSKAISEIVRMIVGGIVKAIIGLGWEALTTDTVGTAILATVFISPVRNAVLGFFGRVATNAVIALQGANIGGLIAGWAPAILGGLSSWITGTVVPFITAAAAPAALIVGVIAAIYIFRDKIISFFTFLSSWVGSNFEGPLKGVLQGMIAGWSALVDVIHGLVDMLIGLFTGDKGKIAAGWAQVQAALAAWVQAMVRVFSNIGGAAAQVRDYIFKAVLSGAAALGTAVKNALVGAAANFVRFITGQVPKTGPAPAPSRGTPGGGSYTGNLRGGTARRAWDGKGANSMPLHSAIASEMANKPPGSDLVIANSSETIIPAAGGLGGGMDGFVNAIYGAAQNTASVFSSGFQSFSQKIATGQQATVAAINKGTQMASTQNAAMLAKLSAQNAALMAKISASPAFAGGVQGGFGGISLGGGYGSRGSQIAGALGTYIKQTGGAPGSIHEHPQHGGVRGRHSKNSYHYQGRAIDIGAYANEQGGVLRRVAAFNAKMGVKPVELLKAGDPGHSDHVHVAYALGAGNPAFFSSASAADQWESMMAGKNPIVSSVRAQANEVGGGAMTVNAPITINAQPGQNTDQLASLVAIKLTQAINQLRYSSYNV